MKCTMDNHGILIHRLFCHSEHSEESPDHLKRVIKLRDPSAPASPDPQDDRGDTTRNKAEIVSRCEKQKNSS